MMQTIGRLASHPVAAIDAEAQVQEALRTMSDKCISCIIIMSHNEPIGILTERDVVFAANWLLGQSDLLVKEVMNKPVLTASEDMTVAQAYQVFSQQKIRHLVVLDARLEMVGIFTQTDLVRSMNKEAFTGIDDVSLLMSSQVLNIAPDVPARYALSLMARRSVSCIVVMKDDQPVGMFTERDVVTNIANGVDLANVTVGSVMSTSIVSTVHSSTPFDTVDLMKKQSVRRLLMVDEDGEMSGILTQTDIGRALDRQEPGFVSRLLGGSSPLMEMPQGAI